MENYRKHIGDLQRTGLRKARVGRRKRSAAGFGILLACDALARAGNTTTTDVRCDIRVSRGQRRTSPCRARHTKIGDRTLGVILQSPEACNVQACAAHAKQKKGDRTRVRSPFILRALRPYQHGARGLQQNARSRHGSCKTHRTRAKIPTKGPLGQEDMLG